MPAHGAAVSGTTGFPIPALSDWRTQARAMLAARLGTDPTLPISMANILADQFAAMTYLELQYLQWLSSQMFAATATGAYLDRVAGTYGLARLGAASAAGNAVFAGTTGAVVPSGTPLLAADGVTSFTTQAAATLASGTATVAIVAVAGGSAGNLATGASLQLQVALASVNGAASVASPGTAGGTDIETDAAFRARLLARLANPPQGGAAADYYGWAKSVAGVTRAWVMPLYAGPGTVGVTFAMDARAGSTAPAGNILPLSADITAVQDAISPHAPVTASITVFASVGDAIAVTVHALQPSSSATQAAIVAALLDLFTSRNTPQPPVGVVVIGDDVDANDLAGTVYLDEIYQAIAGAAGVANFELVAPTADVVSAAGHMAVLGAVTFT
ncbi:MAG: baseplate J/gp47 family protein [Xanthomonadaceae bacterium]|nr:baseplate J/gp47 family protein [Xanthomonadaceae bacterium]